MKRDIETVRRLLLLVESQTAPGVVKIETDENPFTSPSPIYKHWDLLIEAEFVKGTVSNFGIEDGYQIYHIDCELTWSGHDFLDSVRDPELWKKTKEGAAKAGGWTFDLIKDLAKSYAKVAIEDATGIKL